MKKKGKNLLVMGCLTVGIMTSGCSQKDDSVTDTKHLISDLVKDITQGNDIKLEKYNEFIDEDMIVLLGEKLDYIEDIDAATIICETGYSGQEYNSLGKSFFDVTVEGVTSDKTYTIELFLFTGEDNRVIDVGVWDRY